MQGDHRSEYVGEKKTVPAHTSVLNEALEQEIVKALTEMRCEDITSIILSLHSADIADLIERLPSLLRLRLIRTLGTRLEADTYSELDERVREQIFKHLDINHIVATVSALYSDDAADLVSELDDYSRKHVLSSLSEEVRHRIEESLSWPEDSAGRLMRREYVSAPLHWTVGETIDYIRGNADSDPDKGLPVIFYNVFIVDSFQRPLGGVLLSKILCSHRDVKLSSLIDSGMRVIPVTTDQEDVAFLFRQRDLVSAPVVDKRGRMVGVITVDDVVDVIQEENEEDIRYLAGVHEDGVYSSPVKTSLLRFRWLLLNLVTAGFASWVISLFSDTIDHIVVLAILMPIVAALGGNTGMQSMTVSIRALAMRELTSTNQSRLVRKECLVSFLNGLFIAVVMFFLVWFVLGEIPIAFIVGVALFLNMIMGGIFGVVIPLILRRFGVDPAIASSVFLITVTDSMGFFIFLVMATYFLL